MRATPNIVEFEGSIDERGNLTLPHHVLRALGSRARSRFNVRLIDTGLAGRLKGRQVTDAEVDRIATCQRESKDHVLAFLLSEGTLRRRRRPRRQGNEGRR